MLNCKQLSENIDELKNIKNLFFQKMASSPRDDESCIVLMKEAQRLIELTKKELSTEIEWGKYECLNVVDLKEYLSTGEPNYRISEVTDHYILLQSSVNVLSDMVLKMGETKPVPVGKPAEGMRDLNELSKNVIAMVARDKSGSRIRIMDGQGIKLAEFKDKKLSHILSIAKLKNNTIASVSENNIAFWSIKMEQKIDTLPGEFHWCQRIKELKNGNLLLTDLNKVMEIWNPETKMRECSFHFENSAFNKITDIVEGKEGTIEIMRQMDQNIYSLDTKSGKVKVGGLKFDMGYPAIFASDGNTIDSNFRLGEDGDKEYFLTITNWEKGTYTHLELKGTHRPINHIKELPNHTLITIDNQKIMKTWGIREDKGVNHV